jgi:hypothetical protein
MNQLNEGQLCYIAGIVDSEGCIRLHRSYRKYGCGVSYSIEVAVSNTNQKLLNYLRNVTDLGHITEKYNGENARNIYRWRLTTYHLKKFLLSIVPFLRIKKEQALLIVRYINITNDDGTKLTLEQIKEKEDIYEKISELNKRGTFLDDIKEIFNYKIGKLKELTFLQLNYIAALVDGEGTVNIDRQKVNSYYMYQKYVNISNCNINLLIWLRNVTGIGNILINKKSCKRDKQQYKWFLRAEEMKDFLIKIKDYLIVKKENVDLMLEFIDKTNDYKSPPLATEEKIIRELIWEDIRKLNKKGVK